MQRVNVQEFDAEMLAFVLDGDTVQNLVAVAAERWSMAPQEVLRAVGAALDRGELRLLVDDDGVARDVDVPALTPATLATQTYTWMAPTPLTRRLAERVEQARPAPEGR